MSCDPCSCPNDEYGYNGYQVSSGVNGFGIGLV